MLLTPLLSSGLLLSMFILLYFDDQRLSIDSSDPSTFDIYLVNNAIYPSVNKKVATGIKTSKGSYTVDDLDISAGYSTSSSRIELT